MLGLTSELESSCLPGQLRYIIHFLHALIVMQWICHCVNCKSIRWVFLFGLWPRFLGFVLFSAVCFAVSAGETQVWLGDLRVVAFCVVVVFVLLLQSICLFQGLFVLVQSFVCLLSCKDRAISATSATLEEKKMAQTKFIQATSVTPVPKWSSRGKHPSWVICES